MFDASPAAQDFCAPTDLGFYAEEASRYAGSRATRFPSAAETGLGADAIGRALREAFLAGFKAGQAGPAPQSEKPQRLRMKDVVVGLLSRPEGCLTREILDATQWDTVNVHRFARGAGMKIRKERVAGNTYRFYAYPDPSMRGAPTRKRPERGSSHRAGASVRLGV